MATVVDTGSCDLSSGAPGGGLPYELSRTASGLLFAKWRMTNKHQRLLSLVGDVQYSRTVSYLPSVWVSLLLLLVSDLMANALIRNSMKLVIPLHFIS